MCGQAFFWWALLLADKELPAGVPIIRTVGTDLTQRMREYVALHVLRHHRDMPRQLQAQAEADWHAIVVPVAPNRTVGVMGLGNLGAAYLSLGSSPATIAQKRAIVTRVLL